MESRLEDISANTADIVNGLDAMTQELDRLASNPATSADKATEAKQLSNKLKEIKNTTQQVSGQPDILGTSQGSVLSWQLRQFIKAMREAKGNTNIDIISHTHNAMEQNPPEAPSEDSE